MTFSNTTHCSDCGLIHAGTCPRIKRITYYENGMRQSVEYWSTSSPSTPPIGEPISDFLKWFDREVGPIIRKKNMP